MPCHTTPCHDVLSHIYQHSKEKKKKKKRSKRTSTGRDSFDIFTDVCVILELIPFVMPSSETFSRFVTRTVLKPFYDSDSTTTTTTTTTSSTLCHRLVMEIADYFEIEFPPP